MQGYTGSYAINGTNLILQPSAGSWETKDILGIDGNGHPVYPQLREFNLQWGLMSPSDFQQVQDFYNQCDNTGTVVVDLPKFGDAGYQFYSYSGCTLREPSIGEYFNGYITDVSLRVMKVRTG